jgi:transposase
MATQQQGVRGLYIAFELGWEKWVLAFATELAEKPRYRTLVARDLNALMTEIAKAKERFKLSPDAPVFTCYEAGRDGFWLHRYLTAKGITNLVVDAASIEVNRRAKQVKTDPLDAGKLLNQLIRYHHGEKKVWGVVNPPSWEDEDRRQTHRGLKDLQHQRTECSNRIKGLLASLGLAAAVDANFRTTLDALRDWQGQPVPAGMRERVLQEFAVWEVIHRQLRDIENARERQLREGKSPWLDKIRRLMGLKAIGVHSAWVFVLEIFGWRQIRNGKQLGALVGLTPTPYASGTSEREQGISKAGNRHVRGMLIEIAWMWLRLQPASRLSQWYQERFGKGNSRARKVGIVALARKLLIALWKYVEGGAAPEGAQEKDWQLLVNATARRKAQAAATAAAGS